MGKRHPLFLSLPISAPTKDLPHGWSTVRKAKSVPKHYDGFQLQSEENSWVKSVSACGTHFNHFEIMVLRNLSRTSSDFRSMLGGGTGNVRLQRKALEIGHHQLQAFAGIHDKLALAVQLSFLGGPIALVKALAGAFGRHGKPLFGRFGNVLGGERAELLLMLWRRRLEPRLQRCKG